MQTESTPVRLQVRIDPAPVMLPEPDRPILSPMLQVGVASHLVFEGVTITSGDAVFVLPAEMKEDAAISMLMDIEGVLDAKRLDEEFDRIDKLVVLYSNVSILERDKLADFTVIDREPALKFVVVSRNGDILPDRLKALASERDLRHIEPAFRYRMLVSVTSPNDPYYRDGLLWGLDNSRAHVAWNDGYKGDGVVVAIIDSGIEYDHPDIADNMWRDAKGNFGHDFVLDLPDPRDTYGHGTKCAGIVAAVSNNEPMVGIAHKAQLMAVRIFANGDKYAEEQQMARAIHYAVDNGARILSNSWGGPAASALISQAIAYAQSKDRLFVAAAGNSGRDNDCVPRIYPASYEHENIVAVAAIDEYDTLSRSSNFGRNSVDIAAPGVRIWSTTTRDEGLYVPDDGTSFAAPFVAGAAALLWSKNQRQTAAAVKRKLLKHRRQVGALSTRCACGGTLDLGFMRKRRRKRRAAARNSRSFNR